MNNKISTNLRFLRKKRGVSQTQLSDLVGKGHTTIGNWENGISEPNISEILLLSNFFDISVGDLLTTDIQNVQLIEKTEDKIKDKNVQLNVQPSVQLIRENEVQERIYGDLPLMQATATAGFGNGVFSLTEDDIKMWLNIPQLKDKGAEFLIEVTGSSMLPKYNHGDIVACKTVKESTYIQWNRPHVVATIEQGLLVKRIRQGSAENSLLMISDNPNYDPFEVPRKEIEAIALIVGVIRLE